MKNILKRTKNLGGALLALIMVFAMSVTVFATPSIGADAPTDGSITITKPGANFMSYKVLNAVQSGDAYVYTATTEFSPFFGNAAYGNYTVEGLAQINSQDDKKQLAAQLNKFALDNNLTGSQIDSGVKKSVSLGYYLVCENSATSNGAAVASTSILVSVPTANENAWIYDVTIQPKDNTPSLDKKIISSSENGVDVEAESSTANIGDVIRYQVNATVPAYEVNATNIKYTFTDTMSKGLTFDETTGIKVTSGSKVFTEDQDYTVQVTKKQDGTTQIVIDFTYDKIKTYTDLTLHYQAVLNEKAVVSTTANPGNVNAVQLTYTNNPFVTDSYKTLEDQVKTYTWGFGVKKVDSEDITKDLAGAEFAVKDANGIVIGKYIYDNAGNVVVTSGDAVTDASGMVYFTGLKDGDYYIHETKAPAGYSLLDAPVQVTITAVKDNEGQYTGEASIAVSNGNTAGSVINNVTMNDNNILFNVQIKNYKGISLPGTGGIGTKGFFIAGAILVLSALGLLLTVTVRKRKQS